MFFEYNSLLIAAGVAAAAICLTLAVSWLSDRRGGFLMTKAGAAFVIAVAVTLLAGYISTNDILFGLGAYVALTAGLCVTFGAAHQFRTGAVPLALVAGLALGNALFLGALTWAGLTGTMTIALNLSCTALLVAIAREYWLCRAESPAAIGVLVTLYSVLAFTFLLCAVMLAIRSPLTLSAPPENWAESLNVFTAVLAVAGIGALTVGLSHQRLVREHLAASMTDALTGILNRRALFARFGRDPLPAGTSVLLFDLDHFKQINDRHGHGAGDEVLIRFVRVLMASLRTRDIAVRLGGEEFTVILPRTGPGAALRIAERVRTRFAGESFTGLRDGSVFACTVSAGIAPAHDGDSLDEALIRADRALYIAKAAGRNLTQVDDARCAA